MKKIIILALILSVTSIFKLKAQCTAPIINSFSPTTGFIGSTVTISGAFFDATPANNIVYFGATKATVVTASFGTLTVIAPVGASTAPISVTTPCNLTAYSPISFNGIFCPTPLTSTTYQNTAFTVSGGVIGAYNMLSQDIDLDGKPDIVSAYNGLTVARNTSTPGNLSFTANTFGVVGSYNSSISTGDFDGDGKRDLLGTHNIYRNTSTGPGNISFSITNSGFSGYQSNVGDFNNDGKIDVVIGSTGSTLTVYVNTSSGPGDISFASAFSVATGDRCNGIQCADVDGDGKTDILATQGNLNRAITFRNTTTPGASTFTFETMETWPSNGTYPYRCQIADFDKDGRIDLTTCNYNGTANTAIFRNTSSPGDISFASTVNLSAPSSNYRIAVGDVNGDGYPDIVTKSSSSNIFSVYPNTSSSPGTITFGSRYDYTSSAQAEVSGIVIGDLDGDFVPDIATSGSSSNTIRIHRNTSSQNDVTNPTAICKTIISPLSPTGTVVVTPAMIDNGSSDACGIDSLLIDGRTSKTFTCSNIGNNTVTLTVIDRAGNRSTCNTIVNIAAAAIITAGQTTVCQGQTVTLTANPGDTYKWYKDGTAISGATSQTYVATASGSYTVEVTNGSGCSGTSAATVVTVNNNPTINVTPAGPTHLCSGSVVLTANLSSTYQWKLGGSDISGATLQSYTATATGTYSVTVRDLFGCSATSSNIVVTNNPSAIGITGTGNNVINDGDNSPSTTDGTDFGSSGVATSTFTITNSGSGNLHVSSIVISGANPSNFTLGGITLPANIAASASTTFTVTFNHQVQETRTATLTINSSDCTSPLYDFGLTGVGSSKEINLKGNNANIIDGDNTPSAADHTAFGDIAPSSSTTRTYTIENTGTSNLTVSAIALSGTHASMFSASGITLPAVISSNSSTTFTVTFTPTSGGAKTATVTITNDDGDEGTYDFAISGVRNCYNNALDARPTNDGLYTGGVPTNLYLGYGAQKDTLKATEYGANVTWTGSPNTSNLSCTSCPKTIFTLTTAGSFTYTASNGCLSKTVTIKVIDVRHSGTGTSAAKVYVCHNEPVTKKNTTEAVLLRGVPAHFNNSQQHLNCKLGACLSKRDGGESADLVIYEADLEVSCTPNPFHQSFKLNYTSASDQDATILIYGMTGNLIEKISLSGVENETELGSNLSNGIYTISFIQGDKNRVFRMIKVD